MPGATLDVALGKISILTLKEHAGTGLFQIRWTQTNHKLETPSLKVINSALIDILYVDDCSSSAIEPFSVLDMETSILRTVSESSAPPDTRQEISVDAYPLLHYADPTIWNTGICGDLTVSLVHDGLSSEFVTYGYIYLGAATSRFIEVFPTLNTQVNIPGYNLVAVISMIEYPAVTVDVPFTVVVLPCEIKQILTTVGSEYISPYSYTVLLPQ